MIRKNSIFLVGMRGSGKTSVGKALAEIFNWKFVDIDEEIEKETALSVYEIFKTKGEIFFRNKEHEVLEKIQSFQNTVISTGGGIVNNSKNRSILKRHFTIFLDGTPEVLFKRIEHSNRPSLTTLKPLEEFVFIYEKRLKLYENISLKRFDTTDSNIKETAFAIKRFWQEF